MTLALAPTPSDEPAAEVVVMFPAARAGGGRPARGPLARRAGGRRRDPLGRLDRLEPDLLVDLARAGDQRAWGEIERRFQPLARSVARRAGVRAADVPDVLQHTWVQLFRTLPRLRDPAGLAGWIRTTTRRESHRLLRRQDLQSLTVDLDDVAGAGGPGGGDAVEAAVLRQDALHRVQRAFPGLSPRCRALLTVLFTDPSSTYQEIADRLGMPMGSIGPTKARCLLCLRRRGHLGAGRDS